MVIGTAISVSSDALNQKTVMLPKRPNFDKKESLRDHSNIIQEYLDPPTL